MFWVAGQMRRKDSFRNSSEHHVDTRCAFRRLLGGTSIRSYLQKQFQAITGSLGWAVLIQATVFRIGHLYEGRSGRQNFSVRRPVGLLALWQKSLRPGMMRAHGPTFLA